MISIIVPVYNVQPYIDKCITSILNQTYKDLELILIDDGSTDESGAICDKYAGQDERIRVFHVKNGGQSTARNIGMKEAKGDYLAFVDSDDFIESTMYEKMMNVATSYGAHIVESNFSGRHTEPPTDELLKKDGGEIDLFDKDFAEKKFNTENITLLSGEEALERQLNYRIKCQFPGTAMWPKMFKREVIDGLSLPDGLLHEEFELLAQAFLKCDKYAYINEVLYHRTIRDDSTTAMQFSERAFDKLKVFRMRSDFLNRVGHSKLYDYSKEQEYILMLHYYGESIKYGMTAKIKELKEDILKEKEAILSSNLENDKMKKYKLFFFSSKIYGLLYKIKNI